MKIRKKSEGELLFSLGAKDFEVQTFKAGGKGGQYQNKTESAVRIIHRESGAVGESREERSQLQNRRIAFRRLAESEKFQKWHKLECAYRMGLLAETEQWAKEQTSPQYLKTEVKNEKGLWVPWDPE